MYFMWQFCVHFICRSSLYVCPWLYYSVFTLVYGVLCYSEVISIDLIRLLDLFHGRKDNKIKKSSSSIPCAGVVRRGIHTTNPTYVQLGDKFEVDFNSCRCLIKFSTQLQAPLTECCI